MPDTDAAAAYEEIMNVLAAWVRLSDGGRLDEFAELLEPDCTLTFDGIGTLRGRRAILDYMIGTGKSQDAITAGWRAGRGGKHVNVNASVTLEGSAALAESDILALACGKQGWSIVMCQRQRVTLAYTDRWRVREKIVDFPYDPLPDRGAAVIRRAIDAAAHGTANESGG